MESTARKICCPSAILLLVLCVTAPAVAGSASNGVYGGYVGSSAWFAGMRQSAANRAMFQSITGARDTGKLPDSYVEFAGTISFPDGNPFPKGRIPDLRVVPRDKTSDPVERAAHVDRDGSFYTVLKKGQTYDLYWMYYFGSREKFASLHVAPDGARERKAMFSYRPEKTEASRPDAGSATSSGNSRENAKQVPVQTAPYNPPQTGPGFISPGTTPYQAPTTGPGFVRPGSR